MKQSKKRHISDLDIIVGINLRKIRIDKGYTQKNLARCAGITYQQIQKQEDGKNRINSVQLYEYSIILKTPIKSFFEGVSALARQRIRERMNTLG